MSFTAAEDRVGTEADVEVIRPAGEHRSANRVALTDVRGRPVGEMGLAPSLLVRRVVAELRRGRPDPLARRAEGIRHAGRLFAEEELAGERPEDYVRSVARTSGVPATGVRQGLDHIAAMARRIEEVVAAQRPVGTAESWRAPETVGGCGVWYRRGDVLVVQAPGNHPGPHAEWLVALGLGYRVAVRPSQRDPYTPRRLMRALRAAGVAPATYALVPTDYEVADTLVRSGDLAMVYGNEEVVRRHQDDRRVFPQGPGRSKVVVTSDADWREHLDLIVESVAGGGGTACINTTVVCAESEPDALADALGERLAALPSLPPEHPDAVLPVQSVERAGAIDGWLAGHRDRVVGGWSGRGTEDLADGSAVLRPAVLRLPDTASAATAPEMPFPLVWVAPWTWDAGIQPLRDTLTLALFTENERLVDECVDEPGIRNVHLGRYATNWFEAGMPHDGYLAEFLMGTKTVAR
ncbi:aldehyde dehydrogenase family protein [Actinosynnema sp. CS-041913]|uniref:aldehyde dehydrogenase family protein n=1 Tax=Actinosynnema sp. CS-041913 TaxID=3239917 RepID=UPI003D8D0682